MAIEAEDLEEILRYLKVGAEKMGGMHGKIESIGTSVGRLEQLVMHGNGQPSMIAKLSKIEFQLDSVVAKQKECCDKKDQTALEDKRMKDQSAIEEKRMKDQAAIEEKRLKQQRMTAIIVALISALVALCTSFFAFMKHNP